MGKLQQNAAALIIFSDSNDGFFPRIKGVNDRWQIKVYGSDLRPYLRDEVYNEDLDGMLVCPLVSSPSLDDSKSDIIYTSYAYYAGTKLTKFDGSTMYRLGDRPDLNGDTTSVLMADHLRGRSGKSFFGSHDAIGFKSRFVSTSKNTLGGFNGLSFTGLDRNFVFDDGHVETFSDLSGANGSLDNDGFAVINNDAEGDAGHKYIEYVPID